jgi:hypothetical protein
VETLGTARLADEIPAERAVATIVPREEITGALKDPDALPELRLDVARKGEGGGDELGTIAITWSRESLEQLLERATGDSVVLTFDRDELAQAFADVEAHGLRERALVFAVAAVGALGSGAAIANAMPISEPGASAGPGQVTAVSSTDSMVTDASSGGGYTAQSGAVDSTVTDASSGGGYAAQTQQQATVLHKSGVVVPASTQGAAADSIVTDASSAGGYTAPSGAAADSIVTDASSGGGYTAPSGAAADSMVTDASSGGGYNAPSGAAADSMVTDASSGAGYTTPPSRLAADTRVTDASSGGGYAAQPGATVDTPGGVVSGGGSNNLTDELIAGGVLLAIAGATFAGGRRLGTARPA